MRWGSFFNCNRLPSPIVTRRPLGHTGVPHCGRIRPFPFALAIIASLTLAGAAGASWLVNNPIPDAGRSASQSEPSLIQLNGAVIVAFVDSSEQAIYRGSGYALSTDHGKHFLDLGAPPEPPHGFNLTDPVLDYDRAGNVYFLRLVGDIQGSGFPHNIRVYVGLSKSTDGGRTFGMPVDVSPGTPRDQPCVIQDKPWMAVDRSGGTYDGRIYAAWAQLSSCPGSYPSLFYFSRSTDGGMTFSAPVVLDSDSTNAFVAVDPEGTLYIVWLQGSTMKLVRSMDGGTTFTAVAAPQPLLAGPSFQILNGGLRSLVVPNLGFGSATPSTPPSVYATWHDQTATAADDIFFARSDDRGETWTTPLRVNDDQTVTDQFAPALHVTESGTIGIAYYDRRNDPTHNLNIDTYLSQSLNGGRSFLPAERLSEVSSPPGNGFDPREAPEFQGDYIGLSSDAWHFLSVWGDARRSVTVSGNTHPDLDVYCGLAPVHRAVETASRHLELEKTKVRLSGTLSSPDGTAIDPLSSDFVVTLAFSGQPAIQWRGQHTRLQPVAGGRAFKLFDRSVGPVLDDIPLQDGIRTLVLWNLNGHDHRYRLEAWSAAINSLHGTAQVTISIGGTVLSDQTNL